MPVNTDDDLELLRQPAEDAPSDAGEVDGYRHPGFTWLDQAACGDEIAVRDDVKLSDFFAKAGHVLSDKAKDACLSRCDVWRQCVIFSYLGNPDGRTIIGGYFASLSPGQRKRLSLPEALEVAEQMRAEYAATRGRATPS